MLGRYPKDRLRPAPGVGAASRSRTHKVAFPPRAAVPEQQAARAVTVRGIRSDEDFARGTDGPLRPVSAHMQIGVLHRLLDVHVRLATVVASVVHPLFLRAQVDRMAGSGRAMGAARICGCGFRR